MIQTYQFFHIFARFRFTAATPAPLLVSALPAKATFARMSAMSAKCAISGLMHCSNFPLFDHLVGAASGSVPLRFPAPAADLVRDVRTEAFLNAVSTNGAAMVPLYQALDRGSVILVAHLVAIYPLVTLLLTTIILAFRAT